MLAWLGGTALQLQQPALWPGPVNAALIAAGVAGAALALAGGAAPCAAIGCCARRSPAAAFGLTGVARRVASVASAWRPISKAATWW